MVRGTIGRCRWAIAEGHLPEALSPSSARLESGETACLLNAGEVDAHVAITVYFANREPVGPYRVTVGARRTLHVRFDELIRPQPLPRAIDYATVIESDVPIVVQHTRLETEGAQSALMTTMAYAE
jgi:hypothetical protein